MKPGYSLRAGNVTADYGYLATKPRNVSVGSDPWPFSRPGVYGPYQASPQRLIATWRRLSHRGTTVRTPNGGFTIMVAASIDVRSVHTLMVAC